MSAPDDLPREREIRVTVTNHSVRLDFFAATTPCRHYTAVLPPAP